MFEGSRFNRVQPGKLQNISIKLGTLGLFCVFFLFFSKFSACMVKLFPLKLIRFPGNVLEKSRKRTCSSV